MTPSADSAAYYQNMYPFSLVYDWQNFDANGVSFRELAIGQHGNEWRRFLTFESAQDLKRAVVDRETAFFNLGGMYSSKKMVVSGLDFMVSLCPSDSHRNRTCSGKSLS